MKDILAEASWIIGLAKSKMTTRICFGIPHRVGACACQIGKGREDTGVVAATETTSDFQNVVANKPILPGHTISAVAYTDQVAGDGKNDGVNSLATSIRCWPNYPKHLGEGDLDPVLIYKVKGDVTNGVLGSFPKITITMRPLKTVLDYSYTGNFNPSGQGEIGFESPGGAGDTIILNHFKPSNAIPWQTYFTDGGTQQQAAYDLNAIEFETYVQDTMSGGTTVTLAETHYFKSEDRPPNEPTPFAPLSGQELDVTFHPNLPSLPSFDFGRNESIDFRYLYPSDYLTKYGFLNMPTGSPVALPAVEFDGVQVHPAIPQGIWQWQTLTQIDPSFQPPDPNPIFPPPTSDIFFNSLSIKEGIAPVIKGWYWDSSTPPTNGWEGMFTSNSFKMLKQVRKRYPFSFLAKENRTETYQVIDHLEGNQMLTENIQSAGTSYTDRFPATYSQSVENESTFQAIAWWRMEITATLCGWNSKKTFNPNPPPGQPNITIVGATIKGVIKLKMKALQPSYSEQGLYSNTIVASQFSTPLHGVTPSFVFRCVAEEYFDEDFIQRYVITEYEAGEIPWEVTLNEENSIGQPKGFLDFPLTSGAELPGGSPGGAGSVPENSVVYVSDFIVTEVILP